MAASKRFRSTNDASGSGGRPKLAQFVEADAAYHLGVAAALETLADQLPGRIDLDLVMALEGVLEPSWLEHQLCHDELVLPLIAGSGELGFAQRTELGLLEREHYQIAGANDEVLEQLMRLALGERLNYETLGYILRGAFEGRRRHLDWETSFLGRVLIGVETSTAEELLGEWCSVHSWPVLPDAITSRTSRLVLA